MRPLRLARIAAEAEALRLRYTARRVAIRVAMGLVALGFLVGTVVFCHVAAWFWVRQSWSGPTSALILAGADLAVAVVLGVLASRSAPGQVEVEALAVRQRALQNAASSLAISTLAAQSLRLAFNLVRRKS